MPFSASSSTVGLFARPPSHVSSQSHESALPSSPSRMGLDQSCTSHSSESSGGSESARNPPTSPCSLVVKEEPCDIDTVLIKWEMSEERFGAHQESSGSPCQDKESPSVKSNVSYLLLVLYIVLSQNDLSIKACSVLFKWQLCNTRARYWSLVLSQPRVKIWKGHTSSASLDCFFITYSDILWFMSSCILKLWLIFYQYPAVCNREKPWSNAVAV